MYIVLLPNVFHTHNDCQIYTFPSSIRAKHLLLTTYLLREVTEKAKWENYILYMLDMIETTSIQVIEKLEAIINLMSEIEIKIKTEKPKLFNKELLEIIFKLPYTKRKHLIDANLGTPKTVGNYLIALEKMGILKSKKVGKEKLYINHQLMQTLE